MNKPFLSIIIPTHNREQKLLECLISLSNQTFIDYEIIIIDDNSKNSLCDGTIKLFDSMFKDKWFIYYKKQNNEVVGPASSRNIGIRKSQGKILLFLNDDIIIKDQDFLKKHVNCYNNKKINVVLGKVDWSEKLGDSDYIFRHYLTEISGQQFAYFDIKNDENGFVENAWKYFYTCNISVKRNFIELFDEKFPYPAFEDIELGFRLWNKGMNMLYQPDILAYHNHDIDLKSFCERQVKVGESAVIFMNKHSNIQITNEADKNWYGKVKLNIKDFIEGANILQNLNYSVLDKIKASEKHSIGDINRMMLYGLWDIVLKYYFLKGVYND